MGYPEPLDALGKVTQIEVSKIELLTQSTETSPPLELIITLEAYAKQHLHSGHADLREPCAEITEAELHWDTSFRMIFFFLAPSIYLKISRFWFFF